MLLCCSHCHSRGLLILTLPTSLHFDSYSSPTVTLCSQAPPDEGEEEGLKQFEQLEATLGNERNGKASLESLLSH